VLTTFVQITIFIPTSENAINKLFPTIDVFYPCTAIVHVPNTWGSTIGVVDRGSRLGSKGEYFRLAHTIAYLVYF